MMNKPFSRFLIAGAACLCAAFSATGQEAPAPAAAETPAPTPKSSIYGDVYRTLSRMPNRLVGSKNLDEAFACIEGQLRAHGLTPHYETFASLVQKEERCAVTYGGTPVEGVHVIDNGPANFVTDGPLEGPAHFVGDGSLQALEGIDLKDAIAIVDIAKPAASIHEVFTRGAKAIVLVGDGSMSAWHLENTAFTTLTLLPRVYLDRAAAEAAGLLAADGSKTLSIDARAVQCDTTGRNLWVELPAKDGWTARLGTEEVLVLSATLDTYGLTPEVCPDLRGAANAALLTEVACRLAHEGPFNRHVVVVFFGSRYGAQEGARHFYHAIDMADPKNDVDFNVRAERYAEEAANVEELLAFAGSHNIIGTKAEPSRGPVANDLQQRIKKQFVALANTLRTEIADARLAIAALEKDASADPAALAEQKAALDGLVEHRDAVNELRAQLVKGAYDPAAKPLVGDVYAERHATVVQALETRRAELREMIANNASWNELCRVFEGRSVVAHFDFDFARADQPWLLSMLNASGAFRNATYDYGSYGQFLSAIKGLYYGPNGIAKDDWDAKLYAPALSPTYKPFALSLPGQRYVPTSPAAAIGVPGLQMITVGDPLDHDGLPYADDVDLAPLRSQMRDFCRTLANTEDISLRPVFSSEGLEQRLTYTKGTGVNFINWAPGSTDNEGLPRNSVVYLTGFPSPVFRPGQGEFPRARILANGRIYVPFIGRNVCLTVINPLALGFDDEGRLERVTSGTDLTALRATPVHLFYCYGGVTFSNGYGPDAHASELYHPRTLNAAKDAPVKTLLSTSFSRGGPPEVFTDKPVPVKIIGSSGQMLLGSVPKEQAGGDRMKGAMGLGVSVQREDRLHADGIAQSASDSFLLNDARLDVLHERNIVRNDLEKLHADAKDHVDTSSECVGANRWSLARAHQIVVAALENRVYGPLRNVTEDLVQAVVVLLLLSLPFAFAMERLVFGFPSIYKQIGGFIGFFIATFIILYVTHPAFSLASSPNIIFLAFVIILLGSFTAAIMMGKIKQEIRAMQGLASTVHGVENESNTTVSAILIGIAGMRNRPLKTFLTCITVVLLTFTILVFASFSAEQGVVKTNLGRGSGASRIEMHSLSMLSIGRDIRTTVQTLYGDRFAITSRGGLFKNPKTAADSPDRIFLHPASGETMSFGAIMGLDEEELARSESYAKVLPSFRASDFPHVPVYFPPLATNQISSLRPGDTLSLNGTLFTFAGFFDAAALQNVTTIDDQKGVPPDFQAIIANNANSGSLSEQALEQLAASGSFEWFSSENVAIVPMDALINDFGGDCTINFTTLYPNDPDIDLEAVAEEIAPIFPGAIHVKSPEGAKRLFFTKAVAGSGFADVIVPLLLGGLIIFSSLMGSIVAREKEIFTYSALGLAPVDVGALFFAESAVYSVIGGMGGYLLSQLVAKLLKFCGSKGWMTPPEMNFSSLTSVSTILIVMAVVMLSTIVPALRASKSANPGVARKWKMPSPKGDKLEFVFPFTVSSVDFAGILSFIREHFENHADATLGAFAARDVKLFKMKDEKGVEHFGIEAGISLAPFDLGIFQKFRMYSQEFEIKGIDEVVVDLTRIGGTPDAWIRSNRDFAAELREQFLLWRSLPIETIEHYRKATADELRGQP